MTPSQIIFAILFIIAIAILASVTDWFRSKDEPLTETDDDPRIIGDVSKPHSALVRDMPQRVEI